MTKYTAVQTTLISVALALIPHGARAVIVDGYGVQTSASTWANCPSFCTGLSQFDSDGGELVTSANSEQLTYATGRAAGSLNGPTALPLLQVFGSSAVGRRGNSNSFGVQGYTYNGTAPTTLDLDINLHGSITNNSPGYTSNTLSASIAVIGASDLPWVPSFGSLVFEVVDPGSVLGTAQVALNSPGADQNRDTAINFTLNPGDDFYVISSLSANGQNGIADGWGTLNLNFSDASGLTPAAVPLPAALWLFASGLLGFSTWRRRS